MYSSKQFSELLESYLVGKASAAEYQDLLRLVKTGAYDDLLQQTIDDNFNSAEDTEFDKSRSEDILHRILNSEKQTAKLIPLASPFKRNLRLVSIAAAIAMVLFSAWWLIPSNISSEKAIAKNDRKILQHANGANGKKYIRLPDGSTVLLNDGSRLPASLKGNKEK